MRHAASPKAGDFPRYAATYMMCLQRHEPQIPGDLPEEHERWGLCICQVCCDRATTCAYVGSYEENHAGWDIDWRHTEGWRSLSWHVGDGMADWLCCWCDVQDDPQQALDALVTTADLMWEDVFTPKLPGNPIRETLYRATA